jgi:DNA-binding response OmpR family regulator
MNKKARILIVDDDLFLTEYLGRSGFDVIQTNEGNKVLEIIKERSNFDLIILDSAMSHMRGLDIVKDLKQNPRFFNTPIIMQTVAACSQNIAEGIEVGIYFYLIKPYEEKTLVSIVEAALKDKKQREELAEEVRKVQIIRRMIEQSQFRFRTLEEAKSLAFYISTCFPKPENVIYGLHELLINAIEHGNLGITYEEKNKLMKDGEWLQEVQRRLNLEDNKDKYAYLNYTADNTSITIHIKDQGNGFDWQKYLQITPDRATSLHGRGIATTRSLCFPTLQYLGKGNEVLCRIKVNWDD